MELTDDIKPIYLGFEKEHKKYYFYFIKEGIPRFLAYATYFYWDRGPQAVLSLVPVPDEVEIELEAFITGNLKYDFVKTRKNSKMASVIKLYRLPQQVGGTGLVAVGETGRIPNGGNNRESVQGMQRPAEGIRTEPSIPIKCPVILDPSIKLKRKRRTKVEMEELKKLFLNKTMDVQPVIKVVPNVNKGKSKS
jgi:hypothetical protein